MSAVIETAEARLDEYFAGQRREFDVPLMFAGTEFQKAVWNELMLIPHGRTTTYGELARRIGRPAAVRAIANAVGSNALSILVPCHRVIGADGTLTGYAGGLCAKRHLLALENALIPALNDIETLWNDWNGYVPAADMERRFFNLRPNSLK